MFSKKAIRIICMVTAVAIVVPMLISALLTLTSAM